MLGCSRVVLLITFYGLWNVAYCFIEVICNIFGILLESLARSLNFLDLIIMGDNNYLFDNFILDSGIFIPSYFEMSQYHPLFILFIFIIKKNMVNIFV